MSSEQKLRLSETLFEFKRPSDEARKQQEQNESKKDDEINNLQKEIAEKDELLKDMKDKDRQIERLTNQNKAIAIANINANKTKRNTHNVQTMGVDMVQCEYMDVDIKAFYHQNEILRLQKIIDEMKKDNVKQKVSAIEKKESKRLTKELKAMTAKLEKSEIKIVSQEMEMKDVDTLRKQVKKYEKQIAVLKKQKKKSVSSEKTVQIQIAAYEAEIERLQKENDERACMNERDDEEIEQLKRTNAIKDDLIYAYKETIRELKGQNASPSKTALQNIVSPMIETDDGLLVRLSEQNKEIAERDGIIYILQKQAMEEAKEIENLKLQNAKKSDHKAEKHRISKDEQLLMEDADFIDRIEKENERLIKKLDEKKAQMKKKDAQIAGLRKNYNIFKQIDGHHVELHNVSDKMGQRKDYQRQINILRMKLKEKNEEIAEKDSVILILEKHAKTSKDEMTQEIRRLTQEIVVRDSMIVKEDAAVRKDEKLLLEDGDFIKRIEKENQRLSDKLAKKDLKIKLWEKKYNKLMKDDEKVQNGLEKNRLKRKKKIEKLKEDIWHKERLLQGGMRVSERQINGKDNEIMLRLTKMQKLCEKCKAKVENDSDGKMDDLLARISDNLHQIEAKSLAE